MRKNLHSISALVALLGCCALTPSLANASSTQWSVISKAYGAKDSVFNIPYSENFNDNSKIIDANNKALYPFWTIVTSYARSAFHVRTSSNITPAGDGNYLLASTRYGARDDWAISPSLAMKAGTKYTISFKIIATGGSATRKESLKVTVGTDTTKASQSQVLVDLPNTNYASWTTVSTEFTPTADGKYHIGLNLYTPQQGYYVAIDDISVVSADVLAPVAKFYLHSDLWSATYAGKEGERILYPDNSLTFTNLSKNATSYAWKTDGTPAESTEAAPTVNYSTSGTYYPSLTASNASGSSTDSDTVTVKIIEKNVPFSDVVTNCGAYDSISAPGIFSNYNYVTGFNKYYYKIAERYDLPSTASVKVSGINMNVANYACIYLEKDYPITFKIVGDTNGLPDETKVLASFPSTIYTVFNKDAFKDSVVNFKFTSPVSVTGTFHVLIDLDKTFEISFADYLGFNRCSHIDGNATFSAYFNSGVMAGVSGWTHLDSIPGGYAYKGYGALIMPEITFASTQTSVSGVNASALNVYAVAYAIVVNGAADGSIVNVYDISGHLMTSATVNGSTTIPASAWNRGFYIVKVGNASRKVLLK
jgi:PKD repeat protein